MKIIVSQKIEGIAGSEKYLISLLPALNKSGIQADCLILYPKGKDQTIERFEKILKNNNVTVFKAAVSNIPTFSELKRIYRIIKFGKYDLVHSNLISADLIFATIKILFNRKMVVVSGKHGYEEAYTNIYGFDPTKRKLNFYWLCAKFAELFINRSFAISKGLYDLYTGLGITNKTNLSLIHYGFSFNEVCSVNNSFRYGTPQLVIVGRLTAFKGHRYAIQAIKKLVPKYPDIKLVIVGWGELENELKCMVKDLDLQQNIVFTGFNPNPREIMYSSDIVLLPSVAEGFGIVVLEAMSAKRPVVAFNVPSPSEIFTHRDTGLLAEPYSIEEFASLIEELINNKELRITLAENAYIKLTNYYNLERMIQQTIEFYEMSLPERLVHNKMSVDRVQREKIITVEDIRTRETQKV